jgi:hypothetical protein
MPDHIRKQIRDAVKARLTGLPTTGTRVEIGRTRPLEARHDPLVLIYTRDENSQRDAMGRPPKLMRDVQLFVDGRVVTKTPPDDLLDQIALEVEVALAADKRLGGLAMDVLLVRTQSDVQADGESHVGATRMEYRVRCRTPDNEPGTAA